MFSRPSAIAIRLREPMVLIATGKLRNFSVDSRLLEKQRLSATGRFHFAIGPFGDEQIGIDRDRDAFQLACLLERFEEIPEGAVSH